MFSSRRWSLRVPGIGTIHGRCASNQARAIWAVVACLAAGDGAEQVDESLVGPPGLGVEARDGGADVVVGERGVLVDRAGEEAFAERAEGHEADAEFFEGRQDVGLGAPPPQGVLALHGGDGLDGVSATDGGGGGLGHAEVLDLAGRDEFLDGAGDVFDGHVGVDAVLVEQVDGVDAQPGEGGVGDLLDVFGSAGQAGLAAVGVEREAELGGDDDLAAERLQGFADEFLVDERAVDLGGVEEGDAAFDRGADQGDVVGPVGGGAIALAHAHGAEADG